LVYCETGAMVVTVAVLAGGRGSRIGGDKALIQLGGRPLIDYPLQAARAAGLDAVVVAKRHTRLPPLDVRVLIEPDEPTHPLSGIVTALEHFEAVIAIPCDMPFLDAPDLAALATAEAEVAVLRHGGPFPALYRRAFLPQLREAIRAGASVRSTQAQSSAPAATASTREATQFSVNTAEDLAEAERRLSQP
jgi:molybdopterin-guanine dinucleotide biosynthesis protein A